MDKSLSKEDSYADRRRLFKDIWETAMTINEKEDMNKPKVIKTLRLDQVDRCPIGIKKKQRIKNLRTVCNKILDFCDRQDADDIVYEQIAEGQELPQHKLLVKPRRPKTYPARKKIMNTKSISAPFNEIPDPKATNSDRKKHNVVRIFKVSRNTSPIKRTSFKRSVIYLTGNSLKPKPSPGMIRHSVLKRTQPQNEDKANIRRKKTVRKKSGKIKKSVESVSQALNLIWPDL